MPDAITPAQFQALCALLWGDHWQREAGDHLGVLQRNVQFWAAEPPARGKPVPPGVLAELLAELDARLADPLELARIGQAVARQADQVRFLKQVTALEFPGPAGHR
jgi:hypothetical protein